MSIVFLVLGILVHITSCLIPDAARLLTINLSLGGSHQEAGGSLGGNLGAGLSLGGNLGAGVSLGGNLGAGLSLGGNLGVVGSPSSHNEAGGANAKPLFTVLPDNTNDIKDCKPYKALISCKKITLDFDLIKSEANISIPEFKSTMQFIKKGHETRTSLAYEYSNSDGNTAHLSLSKNGNQLQGSIIVGHFLLSILNCGENGEDCQVLRTVDTTKFVDGPAKITATGEIAREEVFSPDLRTAAGCDSAVAEVTVKVYYTNQVAAAVTDVPGLVNLAISETNTGYQNSGVNIHLSLLCLQQCSFNDTLDADVFAASKASYSLIRGSADIAILLVEANQFCGQAVLNSSFNGKTLGVVSRPCATGYYSFGHEMAHTYGALHDRTSMFGSGMEASGAGYNYGYWINNTDGTASGKRTIMAYPGTGYGNRINYYSSSTGITPDGLSLGNAQNDNVRVLNEIRFALAAVGSDDPAQCVQ